MTRCFACVPNVLPAHCRRDPFFLLATGSDPSMTVTTQSCVQLRITSSTLTRLYRQPSSPRTPAARSAYSIAAAVVYVTRPDIASDGALPLLKIVSSFSTPNSERMILTDLCLEHRNYAYDPIASARFSRNRQLDWR